MATCKGTDGAVYYVTSRATNKLSYAACESTNFPYITGDGASSTGVSAARSTEQSYRGTYSFKITRTTTSAGEARFCDNSSKDDMHELSAGKTYKAIGYFYVPSTGGPQASEVELVIAYTTASTGDWNEVTASPTSPYDSWQLAQTSGVALSTGVVGTRCFVRITSAATTGEYFYIDEVRITTGDDVKAEIAGIDSWELTASADNDETTNYKDGRDKKYIQTTVGWSGTIAGSYDSTDYMQNIIDAYSSTDSSGPVDVELELYADETTDDVFIGNFKINSAANTGSIGTKRSFSAEVMSNSGVRHSTYST